MAGYGDGVVSIGELLLQYGELISYVMRIAKESEDPKFRKRVFEDMESHIEFHNRVSAGLRHDD